MYDMVGQEIRPGDFIIQLLSNAIVPMCIHNVNETLGRTYIRSRFRLIRLSSRKRYIKLTPLQMGHLLSNANNPLLWKNSRLGIDAKRESIRSFMTNFELVAPTPLPVISRPLLALPLATETMSIQTDEGIEQIEFKSEKTSSAIKTKTKKTEEIDFDLDF